MGIAFSDPKKIIEQCGIEPGMVIADFGAGAGYFSVEAAEKVGKDGTVYVIDIQQELMTKVTHLAKSHHLDSLMYIHGDLEAEQGSTLPDDCVDMVIISNLLFQLDNKEAVLVEANRILRPRGRLLLVDWRESYNSMGPQPEHVVSEDTARALVAGVGFIKPKNIDAGAYHYGIVFQKHGTN
ncbi:MAG: class I SAM-dependent methyltransferase [Candidatus Pacebacteria bacterium]|nr:class I SAM-dependent methyltransferase [Candidatus Paceibacterota bacterium]